MATALVVAPPLPTAGKPEAGHGEEDDVRWRRVLGLPCKLTVDLAMPDFKVADLLQLRVGSVINAHWGLGRDVPLRLNGTLLGWSEFEMVGDKLAVRVTELV